MEKFYLSKRDQNLYIKLESLFKEWKKDMGFSKQKKYIWNSDGIFPGYSNAKFKILFIGRENRTYYEYAKDNLEKCNNNLVFLKLSEWENEGNNDHFASHYYRRIVEIMRRINNQDKGNNYPTANNYLDYLRKEGKLEFAFMEISKYANPSDDGDRVNKDMVNNFLIPKSIENTQREIEIINPDLIITMNLWAENFGIQDKIEKIFGICDPAIGKLVEITVGKKSFNLLNMYHFSYTGVSDDEIFNAVIKAYRKVCK